MNLKILMTAIVLGSTLPPALMAAENNHSSMSGMAASEAASPVQGQGVVIAVNTEQHKVTLKHEPIPELNWPRMTMVFPVAPDVALDDLSKDDTVTFTLTPSGNAQQVTAISKQ